MAEFDHPVSFVLAATDHGPLITSRMDYHQVGPVEVIGVGAQLLNRGVYDPGEVAQIKALLEFLHVKRGDSIVAIDAGANIGVMTVEMARYMRDWGTVLAFEAQERVYYALCGNVALNNLWNAAARFVALGREDGRIAVPHPNYNLSGSFGSLELRRTARTEFIGQVVNYDPRVMGEIPLVRVDSLNLPRLDFIKIDVEGMELEVLEGARETVERFRPIAFVEWIKCGLNGLREFFEPLDYTIEEFPMNVVCKPKEKED
jgi:FkbM family methyltransferase